MIIPIKQDVHNFLGNVHKKIKITTNDPVYKYFEIGLKALVIPTTKLKEKILDFGKIHTGSEAKASTKLDNKSNMPVKILKINIATAGLSVNLKSGDVIPPNGIINLEAILKPESVGKITGKIIVYTNHPSTGKVEVSLQGEVVD
jgi:hypothetical protein